VWRFSIRGHDLTEGRQLGRLPRLSKEKNKGWEGIFVVDAGVLAAEAVILAVHQAKPRRIGMFDAETLQQRSLLRLPKTARKNIDDLNDVAVAPDGRILLLSGRCGRIAELDLETGSLVLQAIYQIETATGDVPEGITVDAEGRIWICTDGKGLLHQVELVQ
jgi:sugar lactone lactonase YvrE